MISSLDDCMFSGAPQYNRKQKKRIRVWGKTLDIELEIPGIYSSGKVKETLRYTACGECSGEIFVKNIDLGIITS